MIVLIYRMERGLDLFVAMMASYGTQTRELLYTFRFRYRQGNKVNEVNMDRSCA